MRTLLAIVVLLLTTHNVHAAGPVCSEVNALASSAASYRDQGLTQDQLRYPLPPRDYFAGDPSNPKAAELQLMHEIVDELYLEPALPSDLYVFFKTEQCRLRVSSPSAALSLSSALGALKACDSLKDADRAACAAKAAAIELPSNGP